MWTFIYVVIAFFVGSYITRRRDRNKSAIILQDKSMIFDFYDKGRKMTIDVPCKIIHGKYDLSAEVTINGRSSRLPTLTRFGFNQTYILGIPDRVPDRVEDMTVYINETRIGKPKAKLFQPGELIDLQSIIDQKSEPLEVYD